MKSASFDRRGRDASGPRRTPSRFPLVVIGMPEHIAKVKSKKVNSGTRVNFLVKNKKKKFPTVSDAFSRHRFGLAEVSLENFPMVVAPSERTEAAHSGIPQHARCSSAQPAKLVSLQIWPAD